LDLKPDRPTSAFDDLGLKETSHRLVEEMADLYLSDDAPWVVGYSGGKDSTATLSIVWRMLAGLPKEVRKKTVHVISTDTLVENPVVAAWVRRSLDTMRAAAEAQGLPIVPHRLEPATSDTFWVNLIGKGYPSPRPKFRWCTERLKIRPSNAFINDVVRERGEVILVLGIRKAESQVRAKAMVRHEKRRTRDKLSPNASLPNSLVYSPIEDWTNDDVWLFLMQIPNPWGYNNKDLLGMYQGASADGECPLVVDTSTPSCGDSRFGCWVCTMVEQDKSMAAMIQNDEEKAWMLPLLELRNELDEKNDRGLRDHRRLSGLVQLHRDRLVHGPYKQSARARWLRRVLEVQETIRRNAPEEVRGIELISQKELEEIRRIWVVDKHEVEDLVPKIHKEATGRPYPGVALDDAPLFSGEDLALLREAVSGDETQYELLRDLLDVERRHSTMARRVGLFDEINTVLRKHSYADPDKATEIATAKARAKEEAKAESNPSVRILDKPTEGQLLLLGDSEAKGASPS
jgi:DNA sulfur modification protein DndC